MQEEAGENILRLNARQLRQNERSKKRSQSFSESDKKDNNGKKKVLGNKERQKKWAEENVTKVQLKD